MDINEVEVGLRAFIGDEIGSAVRLENLLESDGHAGLTFLFEIRETDGARSAYVIKLPPKGVKLKGNTDVFRQAPLLRALRADGMPVPAVPWAWQDNPWFEVPFIIMERLPGRTFFVWDPSPDLPVTTAQCVQMWEQSALWLARVHLFDWRTHLADWEQPASLEREITRWERIYAQAPEPAWIKAAEAAERALLDSLPDGAPVGLFHGDYQPGNCLYQNGDLSGIIDWELSGIGAQLLDVGWLAMIADPLMWTQGWMPRHPPPLARIRAIYAAESGHDTTLVPWYEALAAYRLASITCLNVKLHRKGQRHDPIWEHNALSVMPMLERAQALIAGKA